MEIKLTIVIMTLFDLESDRHMSESESEFESEAKNFPAPHRYQIIWSKYHESC